MSSNPHSVPCPHCRVEAGEKCHTALGAVFQTTVHWKRKELAAEGIK